MDWHGPTSETSVIGRLRPLLVRPLMTFSPPELDVGQLILWIAPGATGQAHTDKSLTLETASTARSDMTGCPSNAQNTTVITASKAREAIATPTAQDPKKMRLS